MVVVGFKKEEKRQRERKRERERETLTRCDAADSAGRSEPTPGRSADATSASASDLRAAADLAGVRESHH